MTVLGLLILYWGVDPTNVIKSISTSRIISASFVFGISVLCRAQGLVFLGFLGMLMVRKLIVHSDRCLKIAKYIFFSLWIMVIFALPYCMVNYWKPYVMHCESKLDRTDAVPLWCFETIPNIFSFIQYVYWYVFCSIYSFL